MELKSSRCILLNPPSLFAKYILFNLGALCNLHPDKLVNCLDHGILKCPISVWYLLKIWDRFIKIIPIFFNACKFILSNFLIDMGDAVSSNFVLYISRSMHFISATPPPQQFGTKISLYLKSKDLLQTTCYCMQRCPRFEIYIEN